MEAVEEAQGAKGGDVTLWAGEGEAPQTRAATPPAPPPAHPHPLPGQGLADFRPTFPNGLHGRLQGGPLELASTSPSGASLTPSLSLPLLSSPSPLPLISTPLSLPPSPLSFSLSLSSSLSPSDPLLTHTHDCLYDSSDFSTQIDALIVCVCVCVCVCVGACV